MGLPSAAPTPNWQRDHTWSAQFMPSIKRILGEYLIQEAPAEEDQRHNTDLIVLTLGAIRVACRVRHHEYVAVYGDQFTIRATRPSGVKTELAKIIEGWGDYLFYGFADSIDRDLCAWLLGDLKVFRFWLATQNYRCGGIVQPPQQNGDGSSAFHAFEIDELPPNFVIARRRWDSAEIPF